MITTCEGDTFASNKMGIFMTSKELRQKFLDFFEKKGHIIIPSASLIPENDPTTLFTSAGMQPMMPYLLGAEHPGGNKVADSQKCFRTQDIDEVGDQRHTTFFEMLGNWSFGEYFKREQIQWMSEFLFDELMLDPKRVYVTVYRGNTEINIGKDEESAELWQKTFEERGVDAEIADMAEEDGMSGARIFYYGDKKNWWSRAGVPHDMPLGEPGGPDSEMFWDFGEDLELHERSPYKDQVCHVNCDCGRFSEIGNNVFMQYVKVGTGFEPLSKKNVDFGGGLERMTAATNDLPDIFMIDVFDAAREKLEDISDKKYGENEEETRAFRVILDHIRAAMFLAADGAVPSNKDQGYFTRRLIRRAIRYGHQLGISDSFCGDIVDAFITTYGEAYPDIGTNRDTIVEEEEKFNRTIVEGLKVAHKMFAEKTPIEKSKFHKFMLLHDHTQILKELWKKKRGGEDYSIQKANITQGEIDNAIITGEEGFLLYQSYGFPMEMIIELATEARLFFHRGEFRRELEKHQNLSRSASAGKFKGGLADNSEETTKLHTATHLLLKSLRTVLGDENINQKGSNITAERLRFDFNFPRKLEPDELKKIEEMVNEQIKRDLKVERLEMSYDEAKKMGAIGVFENKYGENVSVYKMGGDPSTPDGRSGQAFSLELCGGPHVEHTGQLGSFKIIKEEASSAGVRRIKGTLGGGKK